MRRPTAERAQAEAGAAEAEAALASALASAHEARLAFEALRATRRWRLVQRTMSPLDRLRRGRG